MNLNKPEYKKFLLELMDQVSYPGNILDLAYEVKQAIKSAEVTEPSPPCDV